jgi:hypothetical protein
MSKHKKSPRDKAPGGTPVDDRPLSGKSLSERSSNGKKRNGHGTKELRQTTAAATVVTAKKAEVPPEAPRAPQALKPAQASARQVPPAAKPAQTAKPETAKPAGTVAKPAPVAAKPPVKPSPVAAQQAATAPQQVVETAVETIERSLQEVSKGTIAVNRKLLDFARANLNSSLDHAKDLAAARSPVRIMRLQMEFWHDCLETFASQAQELRTLSAELVAKTSEPIRQHMRKPPRRAAS